MTNIHPTAVIDPKAELDSEVTVGPFCVIGPEVKLSKGVKLHSHVVVDGITSIDEATEIFPFASIGTVPQDLKFGGERVELIIGKNNKIREHATMNPGTEGGGSITRVGDNGLFMIGTHVAHDCIIGNNVILANNATLAGHVELGDFAIVGGLSAVHQFVRIGEHAMIGGMSGVESDVIPYGSVTGERANLSGLNLIGLKRRGFAKSDIHAIRATYKFLFGEGEGVLKERISLIDDELKTVSAVKDILDFLTEETSRGFTTPATQGD
ncbi:acyl-ACP--UDP-N-acetylglucosamine O-acyltransferase [Curvivirga aplysinae]|uniref:acyl-ACP--UDP-N-acetylglucosamine O-acyltransferase n=1 Tax=Curvivirga aplysinae TaxID=2529852 RepID=UPI0012BB616D|nr:acyl-ACP--UDP-N-acetylglucosamine O-acyltransferase [Curvivirga aplysinae]MTI09110.1 acyl-ACP--UDP-N-acetylglucosamine O-acyltransferase [Curvivirga aplysinae]